MGDRILVNMIKDNISKIEMWIILSLSLSFFLSLCWYWFFFYYLDKLCVTKHNCTAKLQFFLFCFFFCLTWYFSLTYDIMWCQWMKYNIWQDCKKEMECGSGGNSSRSSNVQCSSYVYVVQNYVLQALSNQHALLLSSKNEMKL